MMKHKICVLVIDSEPESLHQTIKLLQENPCVMDVESAFDSDIAILKLIDSNPDMILMEYPTKGKAGKGLIKLIKTKLPETLLIFVSKTKEYAANAIKNEVFNYLLKPITSNDIGKIIVKSQLMKQNNMKSRISQMIEMNPEETRLKFKTAKGYLMIDPDEILYCKADGFCTELYLTNSRLELSFHFIKKLNETLSQFNFLRISRSYLINQKYIRKIIRSTNTIVLSCDGIEYQIRGSKQQVRNLSKLDSE